MELVLCCGGGRIEGWLRVLEVGFREPLEGHPGPSLRGLCKFVLRVSYMESTLGLKYPGHALAVHRTEHWCDYGPAAVHLPMVHTSRANDSTEAFSRWHHEALVRACAAHHLQPEHAPLLLHRHSATNPHSRTQGATT